MTASCAKTSPQGTGSSWHLFLCGSSESGRWVVGTTQRPTYGCVSAAHGCAGADDPRPTSSSVNPLTVCPYLAPSSVKTKSLLAPVVGSSARPNARILVPSFDDQPITQALSNNVENPTTASCAKTSSPWNWGFLASCSLWQHRERALGQWGDPRTDVWVHVCGPRVCRSGQTIWGTGRC